MGEIVNDGRKFQVGQAVRITAEPKHIYTVKEVYFSENDEGVRNNFQYRLSDEFVATDPELEVVDENASREPAN